MKSLISLLFLLSTSKALSSTEKSNLLDSSKDFLESKTNFLADQLDLFFATERADDEFGRSQIRLRSRYNIRERASGDSDTQYRFNLKLPSLEKRFRSLYEKDKKKKSKDKLVLEKEKTINTDWIFNTDIGINASIPPKLVTRARLRKNILSGTFIHRFSEQLTYITDESGLVEETNLDSDYIFRSHLIFRFVNNKRWQVLRKNFNTNHGPTLIHRVSEDDAFNYGFTMQTLIEDGIWYVGNYKLSVNYRRNLHKQWIYFDMIPGIDFPKQWSFRRTPFVIFQLEVLFGS